MVNATLYHLVLRWSVENVTKTKDLLYGRTKVDHVGSMAERRFIT